MLRSFKALLYSRIHLKVSDSKAEIYYLILVENCNIEWVLLFSLDPLDILVISNDINSVTRGGYIKRKGLGDERLDLGRTARGW